MKGKGGIVRIRLWLPLLVCALAMSAQPAAADAIGVASEDNLLYSVNLQTGALQPVLALQNDEVLGDIAYLDGTLYMSSVTGAGGPFNIGTVNLTTGAVNPVGNPSATFLGFQSLTANPNADILYTVSLEPTQPLIAVSPNGSFQVIGPTNEFIRGLAYDTNHSILYGVDGGGRTSSLYSISTSTGAAILIGNLGIASGDEGLLYDSAANILYLTAGDFSYPNLDTLYTVNTTTGLASVVGMTQCNPLPLVPTNCAAGVGIDGLAFVPQT